LLAQACFVSIQLGTHVSARIIHTYLERQSTYVQNANLIHTHLQTHARSPFPGSHFLASFRDF